MDDATEELVIDDADAIHAFGARLGLFLAAGDFVMLDGPLGAGKTAMIRGIAEGMRVTGRVASSIFVIANIHRPFGDGPDLVYVDACRLGSFDEVDTLDLGASLDASAIVVEWGEGKVEVFTFNHLMIKVARPTGGEEIRTDCS